MPPFSVWLMSSWAKSDDGGIEDARRRIGTLVREHAPPPVGQLLRATFLTVADVIMNASRGAGRQRG